MATLEWPDPILWPDSTCEHCDEQWPPKLDNDLAWLGLCQDGEAHKADDDLCGVGLLCKDEREIAPFNPFLSDECSFKPPTGALVDDFGYSPSESTW